MCKFRSEMIPAAFSIQKKRCFSTLTLTKSVFLPPHFFFFLNPQGYELQLNNLLHVSLGVIKVKFQHKVEISMTSISVMHSDISAVYP